MSLKLANATAGAPAVAARETIGLGDGRPLLTLLMESIRTLRRHTSRHKTIRALRQLDDRTLIDIGVDRAEIRSLVMDHPERRRR